MARRQTDSRRAMRKRVRPSSEDIGYALRTVFGSREEMREMFAEWEATMMDTVNKAIAKAKQEREKEFPTLREDDPPTIDQCASPAAEVK